jgi:predicted aspartyl protease
MKTTQFYRKSSDELVVVKARVNNESLRVALDTGASHTILDLTALLFAGYRLTDSYGVTEFETGKGVIEAHRFMVDRLTVCGITQEQVEVFAYDYLAHGLLSEYDGVIGLDFFSDHKICLDFRISEITVS